MRAAKVQASLRIRAVSPEPPLLAHTSSESRGTFRQKARSLASLNGWACAVEICHDGMLEDTNSLDGAQIMICLSFSVPVKSRHYLCICETFTSSPSQSFRQICHKGSQPGSGLLKASSVLCILKTSKVSIVARKLVFRVWDNGRLKPACSATAARWR